MRERRGVPPRKAGFWGLVVLVAVVALWFAGIRASVTDDARRGELAGAGLKQNPRQMKLKRDKASKKGEQQRLRRVAAVIERNSKWLDRGESLALARSIIDECDRHGLDPMLVLAVIKAESGFSTRAVSVKGAVGLMQVMPSTAGFLSEQMGVDYEGRKSLYDPVTNVRFGIYYLGTLHERYRSIERALVAYNFGPNRAIVERVGLEQSPPSYVRKVMRYKSELETEARET